MTTQQAGEKCFPSLLKLINLQRLPIEDVDSPYTDFQELIFNGQTFKVTAEGFSDTPSKCHIFWKINNFKFKLSIDDYLPLPLPIYYITCYHITRSRKSIFSWFPKPSEELFLEYEAQEQIPDILTFTINDFESGINQLLQKTEAEVDMEKQLAREIKQQRETIISGISNAAISPSLAPKVNDNSLSITERTTP